jgi:ribonuclease HII
VTILAGIDEAGLGPILGPLVVTGVSFRVPDDQTRASLWDSLRETCTRQSLRSGRRLVITDSKQLYKKREHLHAIERPALVMLAAIEKRPQKWLELLDIVWPAGAPALEEYPWYARANFTLPVSQTTGDIATRANAVRRNCRHAGIAFLGAIAEPLPEGHFNRMIGQTRNKAIALLGQVLRVIDCILRSVPDHQVRILVDRLGGRLRYREHLMQAFAGFEMTIIEESKERSAYRLSNPQRLIEIEFITDGDQKHFPVSLASIYSKYLRELFMGLFNGYWCKQMEGLTPTAGYYRDARRWLRQAEPAVRRLAIDPALMIRER